MDILSFRPALSPFVKWAGGKRQLLPAIARRMPGQFRDYYEPFVGGGAVFMNFQPHSCHISDLNRALINAYLQIRDDPWQVMTVLTKLDAALTRTGAAFYYEARERYNQKLQGAQYDVEAASLFIFLNKHCFNGLYRVNAKGSFNVPYNGSVRPSYDTANLEALSRFLKGVTIGCMDFEEAVLRATSGDFVFFDSPYAPLTASSFEKYTKEGFTTADHLRLAHLFRTLSDRGCLLMLTNHDTPLVRELYQGFSIESLPVKRLINRDAAHRTGREVLITNY